MNREAIFRFLENGEFVVKTFIFAFFAGLGLVVFAHYVLGVNYTTAYTVVGAVVSTGILAAIITYLENKILNHLKNKLIIETKPYPPTKKAPGI